MPDAEKDAPRLRHKCLTLIDGNPCEKRPPHPERECWARTMTGQVVRPITPGTGDTDEIMRSKK